jgi:hypothetical protein
LGTLHTTLLSDRFTFFGNYGTVRADEEAEKRHVIRIMPAWWNGRHDRLKIYCSRGCKSSSLFAGNFLRENVLQKPVLALLKRVYCRPDLKSG